MSLERDCLFPAWVKSVVEKEIIHQFIYGDGEFTSAILPQDKESMYEVVKVVDKAGGYAKEAPTMATMMSTAMGANFDFFKYPPV